MKTLFGILLLTVAAQAQAPSVVTVTVVVDAKTYSVTLTPGSISSLVQHVAAVNADPTPAATNALTLLAVTQTRPAANYVDVGDLIMKQLFSNLLVPAVSKYPPPAVVAAATTVATDKATLAATVLAVSSAGAVTVK